MEGLEVKKEGIILVDKPYGLTSHDVVDFVRKRLGIKKVGHAGTLDPAAQGLLIILVGNYTKLFSKFADFDKEYVGVMKLGELTTTGDAQGSLIRKSPYTQISPSQIIEVFNSFVGSIEQIPPMVSALRVKGKRLYKLARQGLSVPRKPRKVTIYQLKVTQIDKPYIKFYVKCSKGTYIRKLAEDIGEKLGCGAHITKIVRVAVGPFKIENAIGLEELNHTHLQILPL
jgi:tRNA pseudouridine55 synthase